MNIVYTFDDGYSEITLVSIVSLLENRKGSYPINVYIVDCGISDKNKQVLIDTIKRYGESVSFVKAVNLNEIISVDLQARNWSNVCYVRLFFARMFPGLDKILHIDCDTIVRSDLKELYSTDLEDCVCGACYDCNPCPKIGGGFSRNSEYFSNGLILFDLNRIRKGNYETKFIGYIIKNNGYLRHLDQDVINEVLKKKIKVLPPKYNLMTNTALFGGKCCELFATNEPYYEVDDVQAAYENPVVVHLVGYRYTSRPWGQPCYHPYNNEWISYYAKTPYWSDKKMLVRKKKKYGVAQEIICFLWSIVYSMKPFRPFLFLMYKRDTNRTLKRISHTS